MTYPEDKIEEECKKIFDTGVSLSNIQTARERIKIKDITW
jgi:hypothetical protein